MKTNFNKKELTVLKAVKLIIGSMSEYTPPEVKYSHKNMYVGQLILTIDKTIKENKTPKQWQNLLPSPQVVDPDGWDRQNLNFSWYEEKIDYVEYQKRLVLSTVQRIKIQNNG